MPATIVRRHAPAGSGDLDTYGNPVHGDPGGSAGNALVETVCWVQQDRRTEPAAAGEMSDATWTAFLPWGTEVDTSDALEVEDLGRFELVGDPWPARQGSRDVWHVELSLRRTGPLDGS